MQPVNVKCYLIPHTQGHHMVSYTHPLSERIIRSRFTSKEEAFRFKEDTEKKFRVNDHRLMQGAKVADYMPHYLAKAEKPYFPRMKKIFHDFCDTFSDFEPHEITQDVIEIWFKQLKDENDYAEATMFRIKVTTNSFFLHLIREGILRESPVKDMKFDVYQFPERRKRNLLSEDDLQELLKEAKRLNPEHLYPMLLTMTETAARATETMALKWENIDLRGGKIQFKSHARTCSRTLKISSELRQILDHKKKISDYVFNCQFHEPLNPNKLDRMLKNFRLESSFQKPWNPWDLRYSYAYHFLQKGGAIEELQVTMGHCRPQETKKRFEHFLPKA